MARTYLNGKLTVTSLATPSDEDVRKIRALSDEDYELFRDEVCQERRNSPVSDRTVDEIWESALQQAEKIKATQKHAI